jgi:hypothetical protein
MSILNMGMMEHRARRLLRGWVAVLCLGSTGAVHAQPPLAQPADVKAAFLYRFTHYVEWPKALAPAEAFTIAVLGSDEVVEALRPVLARQRIKDHAATVRAIPSITQIGDAQMLYVGPAYLGSLATITGYLRGRAVLVVTDREGALEDGGMINFVMIERRVRFEISLIAARAASLGIGPGLLSVAVNVRGGPRSSLECGGDRRLGPRHRRCGIEVARR